MSKGGSVYFEGYKAGLTPDPDLVVSEWADTHRMLPRKGSPEPGRWKTSRTPYLREIMNALSPSSSIERVVFMKGAQVGGTEGGLNWIGYIVHQAPGPILVVQPTGDTARSWSRQRLSSMIEASPALHGLIRDPRERDSGNSTMSKEFPGGILLVASAKSTARLRSMPVRYLFLDEVDEYEGDLGGQGDPVSLAEKRTSNFAMRKIYLVSTPTFKDQSRIEREYLASDQRRYHVPCPHCQAMQPLNWSGIEWQSEDGRHYPETASYRCEHCHELIAEYHKTWMLENGAWSAHVPGNGKVAGFHLSSLYSPIGWKSWTDIVEEFLTANGLSRRGDHSAMKSWVNGVLGETWEEASEETDHQPLYERRETYGPEIPINAATLTAGVDVQDDRIELEVVAWGRDEESWGMEYKVLLGNPARPEIWNELLAFLKKPFLHESGTPLKILSVCIDSGGHFTSQVYNFVRGRHFDRIYAIKGSNQAGVPIISDQPPNKHKTGKTHLFHVGTDAAKQILYSRLNLTEAGPGYSHFPESYTQKYFLQLTAERLVFRKGKRVWELISGMRNEALDCRVYAMAALEILKTFSTFDLNRLVDRMSVKKPPQETAPKTEQQPKRSNWNISGRGGGRGLPRSGGWMNSWRK